MKSYKIMTSKAGNYYILECEFCHRRFSSGMQKVKKTCCSDPKCRILWLKKHAHKRKKWRK